MHFQNIDIIAQKRIHKHHNSTYQDSLVTTCITCIHLYNNKDNESNGAMVLRDPTITSSKLQGVGYATVSVKTYLNFPIVNHYLPKALHIWGMLLQPFMANPTCTQSCMNMYTLLIIQPSQCLHKWCGVQWDS